MNNNETLDLVHQEVKKLLSHDVSGHGIDHVERVLKLATIFALEEDADMEIVSLAALLHDVDDYKIFGETHAVKLTNAENILERYTIAPATKNKVLDIIRSMGYSKYLEGVRPDTLEGKIVSDADMCDAIGAIGILRTHAYALSKGNMFFDKTLQPMEEQVDTFGYKNVKKTHSVQHFFDKLLKIPSLLMTEVGRKEGRMRESIMLDFLEELFREEEAQEWRRYIENHRQA